MTICSYDNAGAIKFDVDVEMEQGYWNTSQSRLWTRIRDLFHDELVEVYKDMRNNGFDYKTLMSYFYDKQIALIPQSYYNKDSDVKYIPYADQYLGKAHGNGYEHLKRWLKNRIIFMDTLFDFESAYNNDILTIRANTTEQMTITIETYTPLYQHITWKNGDTVKLKVDGKNPTTFTGKVDALTDQEVLIYGGSNIKRITGISSMNPDQMLIGSATRLVELVVTDCPLLTDINSSKANLSAHTYLNKLDLSNCPNLGGTLRLNNSPLIQDINMKGTGITSVQLPSSIRNLTTLRLPSAITSLELNDARLLSTLELEEGHNLNNISLTNCNKLTNCINFDLTQVETVKLDNSYDAEELYMSKTTNLILNNMKNLKRLIYIPNAEVEEFDLSNLMSASEYRVTTFNCPNLTDFITTSQQRLSYGLISDGNIYPNKVFMASLLDLSNTQFTNIKFLCTTDLYKLMLPTTIKNFYCDSAFDLDTSVVTDGNYDIVHGDLIEPYTTNYESNVYKDYEEITVMGTGTNAIWIQGKYVVSGTGTDQDGLIKDSSSGIITDYLPCKSASYATVWCNQRYASAINCYDENKNYISTLKGNGSVSNGFGVTGQVPLNTRFIIFSSDYSNLEHNISYTAPILPNIVPTSANGSLIYNVWSLLGTQPSSTSPYIWDLTGLKFNDFHTYGMNNWVKPSDDSYINIVNTKVIDKWGYGNNIGGSKTNWKCLPPLTFDSSVTTVKLTSDYNICYTYQTSEDGSGVGQSAWGTDLSITFNSESAIYRTIGITLIEKDSVSWIKINCDNGKNYIIYINDLEQIEISSADECKALTSNIDDITVTKLGDISSITMPQRTTGYSVRLQNADITPNNYNTMLYPLFIDTTLPITGKLDYSKYKGNNLSWAFAYTTNSVNRIPLASNEMGNVKYDYNKLYSTDFIDITDAWIYKDTDCSLLSNNSNITKVQIELTNDNYKTRVDEVLQHYPNATEVYFFEDGNVTSLESMFASGNNGNYKNQIKNIYFIDGYFSKLTSIYMSFRDMKLIGCYNIPNSIIDMMYSFYNNPNLTTISNLPNSLQKLSSCFMKTPITNIPNIPITVKYLNSTFKNCVNLNQEFDLSKNNISDGQLASIFEGCSSLTYIPILPNNYTGSLASAFKGTKIKTAPTLPNGVNNLSYTFSSCTELTTVGNIPSSCDNYLQTFYNCSKLTSVPQEGWKGKMQETFNGCKLLNQQITIGSFTNALRMFGDCSALSITPTFPSNSNVIMQECFKGCTSLVTPPITPNGTTTMLNAYKDCTSMTSAPNIPSSCKDIRSYLSGCSKIIEVTIPVDVITSYSNALSGCSGITNITWTGTRTTDFSLTDLACPSYVKANVKELVNEHLGTVDSAILTMNSTCLGYLTIEEKATAMMKGWNGLEGTTIFHAPASLDATTLTTNDNIKNCVIQVTDSNYKMRLDEILGYYSNCVNIYLYGDGNNTTLFKILECGTNSDAYNPNTKTQVKTITFLKNGFSNSINLQNAFHFSYITKVVFNNLKVNSLAYSFQGCGNLTTVLASELNTSELRHMEYSFNNCKKLTTLDVSNWDMSYVKYLQYAFDYCSVLTTLDVSNWDTSSFGNMNVAFGHCSALTTLDISKWNLQNATSLNGTFMYDSNLSVLDFSNTNLSKVENIQTAFIHCSSLKILNFGNSNTILLDCKYTNEAFSNCTSLTYLNLSKFRGSTITQISSTFKNCTSLTDIVPFSADGRGLKLSHDLSTCTSLSASELVEWINSLATVTDSPTLTLGSTNLAKLTDEQKALATNKGWTLA